MTAHATVPGPLVGQILIDTLTELDYWPTDSVVLVLLDDGGAHLVTARCDLADLCAEPAGWRDYLSAIVTRIGATSVLIVMCDPADAQRGEGSALAAEAVDDGGAEVLDVIAVFSDESGFDWTSMVESAGWVDAPLLHRVAWSEIIDEPGRSRPRTRHDLQTELVRGAELPLQPWVDAHGQPLRLEAHAVEPAVERAVNYLCAEGAGDDVTPQAVDLPLLLASLADKRVRDTVIWDILHAPTSAWARAAERLVPIVRRAAPSSVAAPATILSLLRWQLGDGTRALIAVDRALDDEPDYVFAELISRMIASGMSPAYWREGLLGLTRDQCTRLL